MAVEELDSFLPEHESPADYLEPFQGPVMEQINSNFKISNNTMLEIQKANKKDNQPSTFEDYVNVYTPFGIQWNNPELQYYSYQQKTIDTTDPQFQEMYEQADGNTKLDMLNAKSTEHAKMIFARKQKFQQSLERTKQDPWYTQVTYGLGSAIFDPTTYIPIGGWAAKAAKTSELAMNIGRHFLEGAAIGAGYMTVLNGLQDAQGLTEPEYLNGALWGAVMGGTFQSVFGPAMGPRKDQYGNLLMDTSAMKEFAIDHNLHLTEGDIPQVLPERVGMAPTSLGLNWLKSDADIVYNSQSEVLRSTAMHFFPSTVALHDAEGNIIPNMNTTLNIKKRNSSQINVTHAKATSAYHEWLKSNPANKMRYEEWLDNVSTIYTDAMETQKAAVHSRMDEVWPEVQEQYKTKHKEELKALEEDLLEPVWYYRDEKGKHVPATEEDVLNPELQDKLFTKPKTKKKEYNKAVQELREKQKQELRDARQKQLEELVKEIEYKFEGDPHMVKAAEAYSEFFSEWGKYMKKLGIKELEGFVDGLLYRPRMWNFEAMGNGKLSIDTIEKHLYKALMSPRSGNELTAEEAKALVKELTIEWRKKGFNAIQANNTYLAGKDLPWETTLKAKKIKLDESELGPLLLSNVHDVAGRYSYRHSGRTAIYEKMGVKNGEEFKAKFDEVLGALAEEGKATSQEILAFTNMIEDIMGTRRLNQFNGSVSWANGISNLNTLRLGGKFGMTTFAELMAVTLMLGLRNSLNGGFLKSFTDTWKVLMKGEMGDEISQFLLRTGYMEEALQGANISKFTDVDNGFNMNRLERTTQGMAQGYMKYNGMRFFQAAMERVAAGGIWEQIQRMARKGSLSKTELKRLARWGLNEKDMQEIAQALDKHLDYSSGRLHLDKWDKNTLEKFQLATDNAIQEFVIQGDSIHVPDWFKNRSGVAKLITQFMRFPLIAHSTLLRRGFTEEQAQLAAGAFGSVMTMMAIKYLTEQAEINLGVKDPMDSKFDFTKDDDQLFNLTYQSLMYATTLGMFVNMGDALVSMTQGKRVGQKYGQTQIGSFLGPTAGYIDYSLRMMPNLFSGDWGHREWSWLATGMPFQNIPLWKETWKSALEELDW